MLMKSNNFACLPVSQSANLDETYEELYDEIIERLTKAIVEETPTTELVLVPSLRDITHDRVYPQPPLNLPASVAQHLNERVHCVANPATITLKEMVIGMSSVDALMDLTKAETSGGASGDRMGRLANHLLQQRSYYPLLPPAIGVNMEYEQMDKIAMPVSPDILLLPSELRHFVKSVNGTLAVNPGMLTKHNNGGTFSRIAVHAPRRSDIPETAKRMQNSVNTRSVVKIVRI